MQLLRQLTLAGLLATLISPAFATNGYVAHGYGVKSRGMAGAGIANPQDSMTAATNPAGIAFVGNRVDISAALFSPHRSYEVTGTPTGPFPLANGKVDSQSDYFVLPEISASWQLNDHQAIGIAFYGHGGMNTDYSASDTTSNGTFGAGHTGVDLAQLFLSPNFAYRFDNDAAIGIGAILAYQRFEIKGINSFSDLSNDSTNLSNNGHDHSFGGGINLGFILPVSQQVTVGGRISFPYLYD